jgi:hypothetical protein
MTPSPGLASDSMHPASAELRRRAQEIRDGQAEREVAGAADELRARLDSHDMQLGEVLSALRAFLDAHEAPAPQKQPERHLRLVTGQEAG